MYKPLLVCLLFLIPGPAVATLAQMDLTCVLNGLNARACVDAGTFGKVTLTDVGVAAGSVRVTVDLVGTAQKFRDLLLNLEPATFTGVSSSDGQVTFSLNTFQLTPYTDGSFDLGKTGGQGWNGDDLYTTIISADQSLTVSNFLHQDTGNRLFAALHIQNIGTNGNGNCDGNDNGSTNCAPGFTGPGSLKIGSPGVSSVPEPRAAYLVGAGLLLLLSSSRARLPGLWLRQPCRQHCGCAPTRARRGRVCR